MKKLVALLMFIIMLCPSALCAASPIDVPSDWAVDEVNEAIAAGLVPETLQSGYMEPITREEFCNTLVLLVNQMKRIELPHDIPEEFRFADTNNINVILLRQAKIVTGVGDGLFNPKGNITRQEAAVMLTRAAVFLGKEKSGEGMQFDDAELIASWAANEVSYVTGAGIMTGTGAKFEPLGLYDRQQTFVTMLRLYRYLETKAFPVSSAANYIESQLAQYDHRMYVYRDFGSGENTFTQKAFMGNVYSNVPLMEEYSEGYSGISGIKARLSLRTHTWGGYMFLNGGLSAGSDNPYADYGRLPNGYDLTGASKLVFWAKGETGRERIEFFMGTLQNDPYPDSSGKVSLGYITLGTDWTKYEIPLTDKNLSRVNNGFGWVTNDTNNPGLTDIVFYMDEIYYEFLPKQTQPTFLQSYESAKVGTDEYIINNFAYSYDNAMAVMALCYAGKFDRAKQVADALVYAVNNDRDFNDGRIRNAYSSGDPRSFPNWFSKKGAEFVRMPGFWDVKDNKWYEDKGTVSTSVGNAAWVILGLMEAYRSIGDESYLNAAKTVGDFVLTFKSDTGGFTGGYEGWESERVTWKSTEHNINLISVYAILANYSDGVKKQEYQAASDYAKEFVISMYDARKGCFYTGTTPDGVTINKDVLPLDTNTWALLAMPDFTDSEKVMRFVEDNMKVGEGYDFNEDCDGIWHEGTAQVAVVYQMLGNAEKYNSIMQYLNGVAEADGSITAADRNNVTTGFDWEYGKRIHLGATAWLAFAQMGQNPYAVE